MWAWFVLLTMITMGPVITHFSRYQYGVGTDNLAGLYTTWWMRYASRHHLPLENLFFIHYPIGVGFEPPSRASLKGLLRYVLLPGLNEVAIFNVQAFLYLLLSGLCMYWLVRYLTNHRVAAAIAGSIYMWAPSRLNEMWLHIGLGGVHWIILYFLALINYAETLSWKRMAVAGLLLGLTAVNNPYLGLFAMEMSVIFFFVFAAYQLVVARRQLVLKMAGQAALLSSLVLGLAMAAYPSFLMPTLFDRAYIREQIDLAIRNQYSNSANYLSIRPPLHLYMYSALPWDFIVPSYQHPVLGSLNDSVFEHMQTLDVQFEAPTRFQRIPAQWLAWTAGGRDARQHYLGVLNVLLAVYGIWSWRKNGQLSRVRDIGTLFLLAMLLSAPWIAGPPQLPVGLILEQWLHITIPGADKLIIVAPSYWLYDLVPQFRFYSRMGMLAVISVVALSGIGLAAVLRRTRTRWQFVVIAAGALALGMFEYTTWPPRYVDASGVAARYEAIMADGGEFAIVDDFTLGEVENHLRESGQEPDATRVQKWFESELRMSPHQRYHRKPVLNPVWWQYILWSKDVPYARILSGLNVRYIVASRADNALLARLTSSGGINLVATTKEADVFAVEADPAPVMVYGSSYPKAAGTWQSQPAWTWTPQSDTLYLFTDVTAELCISAKVAPLSALPFEIALAGEPDDLRPDVTYEGATLLARLELSPGLHPLQFTPSLGQPQQIELEDLHLFECSTAP